MVIRKGVNKKKFDKEILEFQDRFEYFNNAVESLDDYLDKDVLAVEKWIIERRKFFIKLAYLIGFVILLFVITYFFSR